MRPSKTHSFSIHSFYEKLRARLRIMKQSISPSLPIYFPHMPGATSYLLPKAGAGGGSQASPPVPPKGTWVSEKYGKTDEEYLASGRRDVREMLDILNRAGVSLESPGHILEFGCGDGRMIRWLEHLAADREIWGTDINAGRIFWCKQNLNPSIHFITTTTIPHLPFEDRHFGFIFAGSVFTHIDDLADTWIAELRRILRPGGNLFITVHLKNDITLINDKYCDSGMAKILRSSSEYDKFAGSNFDMFTVGRSSESFVFYDMDYLRKSLEPMFRILSVTEGVRLNQSALLLERT